MGSPSPGWRIGGKYELVALLGEGGMGRVFEARHVVTGRRVAVKVLKVEASRRTEAQRRFLREARAIGRVEDPHVVEVLDAGMDEATGAPFVVQTLLRGVSLRAYLRTLDRIEPVLAARLAARVLRGLGAAHAAGVVHRDVKPSNVFLSRREGDTPDEVTPKVIDFGISKLADAGDVVEAPSTLTASGVVVGTVGYMAPEQAEGRDDVDGRADLWAVGVMLYEMISGDRPFDAPSTTATLLRIVSAAPPPLDRARPDVPKALADVVMRALQREPADRWSSAAAMLEALEHAVDEPLRASTVVLPGVSRVHEREVRTEPLPHDDEEKTPETVEGRQARGAASSPPTPSTRKSGLRLETVGRAERWRTAAASVALLGLGVVAVYVASSSDDSGSRERSADAFEGSGPAPSLPASDRHSLERDSFAGAPSIDDWVRETSAPVGGLTASSPDAGRASPSTSPSEPTRPVEADGTDEPRAAGRSSMHARTARSSARLVAAERADASVPGNVPRIGAHGSPILSAD